MTGPIAENTLEVGHTREGEVVINHPNIDPDETGTGHIVFSPAQARMLAHLLIKHAAMCEQEHYGPF
jgi:hypothetical protein